MERNELFDFNSSSTLERGPSLANQAYKRIKTKFLLGEVRPGHRFTYREIANELGVSVTPAREAILKLLAERIFEPGASGTVQVPELHADTCRELWRIRILLEGPCAELAVENADNDTIKSLEAAHFSMIEAKQKKNLREALKFNYLFHFNLYQKANSPLLVSLIQDLWARSTSYVHFFHLMHVEKRGEKSSSGPHVHSTIIAALKAGDSSRVRNGIERDLLSIQEGILLRLDPRNLRADQNNSETDRVKSLAKKHGTKAHARKVHF